MAYEVIDLDGENDSDDQSRENVQQSGEYRRNIMNNNFSLLSDSDSDTDINTKSKGASTHLQTGDDHQDDFLALLGVPKERPKVITENINIPSISASKSHINDNISSDVICLDEEEEEGGNVNDSYVVFPTSSPNINRERDISIIISDDEQIPVTNKNVSNNRNTYQNHNNNNNNNGSNISSSIMSDISSIIMNDPPLPYPITNKKRRSSSIGSITIPSTKPKTIKRTSTDTNVSKSISKTSFNIQRTNDRTRTSTLSTKNSRTSTNDIFNTPIRRPSSVISDFSSSLNEIVLSQNKENDDDHTQKLKQMKKKQSSTVKNLISDLQKERQNKDIETGSKYSSKVQSAIESTKKEDDDVYDTTISNSSMENLPRNRFIDVVTDNIDLYTEERLELLYEKSRELEPQKLRKINQVKYSKDELTEKMTCMFSSKLNDQLKTINNDYSTFIETTKFEIFEDLALPIIKFSRYTDSVYYKTRSTFVPIIPRQIDEKFLILLYDANDLIKLFKEKLMKRHINSVKLKYKNYKVSIWILGYDQFLQNLKTKYSKLHAKQVQEKLNKGSSDNSNVSTTTKRRKKHNAEPEETLEDLILPDNIREKILKYEIEHDVIFQMFKGLKDMLDWLKSYAYTLSCKHIDALERNDDLSNIGKVKSKEDPVESGVEILKQFKNMKEDRAKKIFTERKYDNIAGFYKDIKNSFDFVGERLLRNDQQALFRKLFKSLNEDELLI